MAVWQRTEEERFAGCLTGQQYGPAWLEGNRWLIQQPPEQLTQQNSIAKSHLSELHPHPLARRNISYNPVSLNDTFRYFQGQSQARTDRPRKGHREEHTSHAQRCNAGNLLVAAAIPAHAHAVRR